MDVARVEAAEREIDSFINRRAKGAQAANEEAARQSAVDTRRGTAARLVNARAWAEYFGGLSLAHHDAAARYAQKRDEARALVRELQAKRGAA